MKEERQTMIRLLPVIMRCTAFGILTLALSGCLGSLGGGGAKSSQTASVDEALIGDQPASTASTGGPVDVRQFYGSGYCPNVEIRDGTEALRTYVKPKEPSPNTIIWQASIGQTARQCLEDPNGTMTIKIGVSGRVLAGPKGGPRDVTVPVRVAVVKFQEAVLASELHKEQVTIGPDLSTVFRRVYQVEVPSPGNDRDYIIYVGFDDGGEKR